MGKTGVGVGRPQPQVSVALGQDRRRPGRAQPLSSRAAGGQSGCVGIRRGLQFWVGVGGPPWGRDYRIRGRRGLGSRLQGPREEGLGVQTPESEGIGVGSWTPGSEGERAGGPDSRVRGARQAQRRRPQATPRPPTAAPRCLRAAGETETRASAPVQGPGPPSFFPGHKEDAALSPDRDTWFPNTTGRSHPCTV